MLYSLLLLVVPLAADGHDHGDHSGHQHTDETIAACECSTGITTDMLASECSGDDFDTDLGILQTYLTENDCSQYCTDFVVADGETAFRCYQVFALLTQIHDYCASGTVDEELFHDYLDSCPDCYQNHLFIEGAPECDAGLNCTDTEHQIEDVELVLANCTDVCPDTIYHDGEEESCNEVWQHVEGYHRMCAHTELTVEFEKIYDTAAFTTTVCTDTHCNVPWEINGTANCSSSANMKYMMLNEMYGDLVIDELNASDDPESEGYKLIVTMVGLVSMLAIILV